MKKQLLITLALTATLLQAETLKDLVTKDAPKMSEMNLTKMIKELNSTKVMNHHGSVNNNPYYQGEIVKIEQAGAYTYLEIKEKTQKTFWVAVSAIEPKVGDFVRFQMELVTKNFKSKALNKTFDEVMFASNLQYRVTKREDGNVSK